MDVNKNTVTFFVHLVLLALHLLPRWVQPIVDRELSLLFPILSMG